MADLLDMIKGGATIVDVRTIDEYEEEHYPNAKNIPVDQVQERLAEFGEKNSPVIVYCASGARSAFVARILKRAGFTSVVNAGGLADMPE